MKRQPIILFFMVLLCFCIKADNSNAARNEKLSFLWAFGCRETTGDSEKTTVLPADFTRDRVMPGSAYKIFLCPITETYLYLFYHNSEKEGAVLFPGNCDWFRKNYKGNSFFIPPEKNKWYTFRDCEYEEFLLIAADRRLPALEKLMTAYIRKMSNKNTGREFYDGKTLLSEEHNKLIKEIKSEMEKWINSHPFTESSSTAPIRYSGKIWRGSEEDLKDLAVPIETDRYYAKRIRILH